jgi:peptidylprolyl isomerase
VKRSLAAVPLALLTVLSLAACSPDDSSASSPDDTGFTCAPSGKASDSVKVTGSHGDDLKLQADTPLKVDSQETSVLDKGKGKKIQKGDSVSMKINLFSGDTGKFITSEDTSLDVKPDQMQAWIGNVLACGTTDGRMASVAPVSSIWEDVDQVGLKGLKQDGTVVMVFDMNGKLPGTLKDSELLKKSEGKKVDAPADFPKVETDKKGEPTITIPEGQKPPKKLEIATLIQGDGEKVKPGDRVYVNYRGVIWNTGEEFDSSWSRGKPADFTTDGVIGGFRDALEGQNVGSQVISVVPAEDGGYGPEQLKKMGHKPDDVMVFVLDILGTVHAD